MASAVCLRNSFSVLSDEGISETGCEKEVRPQKPMPELRDPKRGVGKDGKDTTEFSTKKKLQKWRKLWGWVYKDGEGISEEVGTEKKVHLLKPMIRDYFSATQTSMIGLCKNREGISEVFGTKKKVQHSQLQPWCTHLGSQPSGTPKKVLIDEDGIIFTQLEVTDDSSECLKKFQQKEDGLDKLDERWQIVEKPNEEAKVVAGAAVPECQKLFQQKDGPDKLGETNSEGDFSGTEAREKENLEQMASRDKVQWEELKDLPNFSIYLSLKDGKDETRVLAAAKGAVFLAQQCFSSIYWTWHEKVFLDKPDTFERVKHDLLLILIKLVLTIFDLEDFNRVVFKEKIHAERMQFLHELNNTPHKTTVEAILAIAKGAMNFGDFHFLLERDVSDILEQRERHSESFERNPEAYMADAHTWLFEDVDISQTLVDITISIMKKFPPLKRNCAMHLMMELIHGNCSCIYYTLFLEYWRDIDVLRLEEFTRVSADNFSLLLQNMFEAMSTLVDWRTRESSQSMFSASFPLIFGAFGACMEEVIDVVEHADCERRWEGHRFIGTRHLLLGLLRSRIAESVLKFGCFRLASKESSMHLAVYEIYKVAEEVTKIFGVEEIKLEHLFLAIMVVNLEINQHPQWVGDLQRTRKGLAVEEYIPVFQERILDELEIDLGNLDTKAFVGNGIANEGETWDADSSRKMIEVIFEARKFSGREQRLENIPAKQPRWFGKCPLWDAVQPIAELCKSHELPQIWAIGGQEGEGKKCSKK